ncbi:MAG: tripartite tricarboxylate transporter permease [Rhodospirillaceae bacterium]|jgi:putative tricarboxylic transport membrane protein|nr:tripartite tricarboxylate transporter permease [Rhodospirillaceae bacterium]MBT7955175.1 tripartite tricarboxylate transporter permease [Rhodospirillaceae bacterium]
MGLLDHIWLGIVTVFTADPMFSILGLPISTTIVMVILGFLGGIFVGATPGIGGPFAMAISLPILISIFGFNPDALLPVLGFLVGIMKGSTIGGAVPAILFNTPGTPDSLMTTLDGYPMTKKGKPGKALRIAHFSSVSGDTFSDIVLITCAPFLAILVEKFLDFPEKAALIILSLAFVSAVVGANVWKGLVAAFLGMFMAYIGTGEDGYSRLSLGNDDLAGGFPLISAVLGVLIIGEVFKALEEMWREMRETAAITNIEATGDQKLRLSDIRRILPFIGISASIGTMVGALPGIGSTLAATLGYATGRKVYKGDTPFGEGAPEGIAATEAANSAVAGANLIPVLSLGIPGNVSAVFILLATETISGFNPGPAVFRLVPDQINQEMVYAFGLFTAMIFANGLNWTFGGVFMRWMGVMVKIPKQRLLPIVLLLTLTAIYVQQTSMFAVYVTLGFGLLGYVMRKLRISVLPFVIAFILANNLEEAMRQAFAVTGADPWFLFASPISITFIALAVVVVIFFARNQKDLS